MTGSFIQVLYLKSHVIVHHVSKLLFYIIYSDHRDQQNATGRRVVSGGIYGVDQVVEWEKFRYETTELLHLNVHSIVHLASLLILEYIHFLLLYEKYSVLLSSWIYLLIGKYKFLNNSNKSIMTCTYVCMYIFFFNIINYNVLILPNLIFHHSKVLR